MKLNENSYTISSSRNSFKQINCFFAVPKIWTDEFLLLKISQMQSPKIVV